MTERFPNSLPTPANENFEGPSKNPAIQRVFEDGGFVRPSESLEMQRILKRWKKLVGSPEPVQTDVTKGETVEVDFQLRSRVGGHLPEIKELLKEAHETASILLGHHRSRETTDLNSVETAVRLQKQVGRIEDLQTEAQWIEETLEPGGQFNYRFVQKFLEECESAFGMLLSESEKATIDFNETKAS